MKAKENLEHWETWALRHGDTLAATTKCLSIKKIEIDALTRNLQEFFPEATPEVLEVGCGNGFNGVGLLQSFPKLRYHGVDFSEKMIANARVLARSRGHEAISFGVLDARELRLPVLLEGQSHSESFDAVFTDRMLINLASASEQLHVMTRISEVLKPGGIFLMLENSVQSHRRLNDTRTALGLPIRPHADYNIFIDEPQIIEPFKKRMQLIRTEYISGVHDLMLYAVAPAAAKGEVEYDSPIMKNLTEAIIHLKKSGMADIEGFGQNILWVWRKSTGK